MSIVNNIELLEFLRSNNLIKILELEYKNNDYILSYSALENEFVVFDFFSIGQNKYKFMIDEDLRLDIYMSLSISIKKDMSLEDVATLALQHLI